MKAQIEKQEKEYQLLLAQNEEAKEKIREKTELVNQKGQTLQQV